MNQMTKMGELTPIRPLHQYIKIQDTISHIKGSTMSFRLSPSFLATYIQRPAPWGFGALSWFTYQRTYSRDGEQWQQTCQRVIEGMFSILEQRCKDMHVPFDARRAQGQAQDAYERMFVFKWLPPGRGLWMMGTQFVKDEGSACLNNCFASGTRIITDRGVVEIGSLSGKSAVLLSEGGRWIEAPIKSFGEQRIWKLTLRRQGVIKEIFTTEDHGWFAIDRRNGNRGQGHIRFKTSELRPEKHRLQHVVGGAVKGSTPSPVGIAHGITYGDGTTSPGERHANHLYLCGDKNAHLASFFSELSLSEAPEKNAIRVASLPNSWRELPSISENTSYLYGWLAGYFSADGTVKGNGQALMTSSKIEDMEFFRDVCYRIGIGTYGIRSETRISNLTNKEHTMHSITLDRSTLTSEFFLIDEHRQRFEDNPITKNAAFGWTVVSVEDTGESEEVFCATVPDYGKFALEDNILTSNCGFVSSQDIDHNFNSPFIWMFQMLMLGVGIGFDTLGHHHKIPVVPVHHTASKPYVVPDTRQGWCAALDHYLELRMQGCRATFDYSEVRPFGAPIKRFGGTASGPEPLKLMFTHMDAAFARTDVVNSTLIADIANIIGQCVVSGNVRRSAQIALGEPGDKAFAALKSADKAPPVSVDDMPLATGDFNEDFLEGMRPWMWSSNNSLTIHDDDDIDFRDYQDRIGFNGEPGFFWIDNAKNYGRMVDGFNPMADPRAMGVNPCVEQTLENYELCCLVETFPAHHDSLKDFQETLKVAYLYAKAVTCLPTHDERTNAVMRANSRIGCSMSGITQAMSKFGTGAFFKMCDASYKYIQRLDHTYSRWLCSPESIKKTSVKPSGTVSLLAGATPGCHDDHSPFSIRRVRVATSNPIWEHAKKSGYHVEEDVKWPNTMVLSFPVATKGAQRPKASVTMWEQFSRAAKLQRFWADNQVSATITFQEHEIEHIPNALEHYADQLKGVSMLSLDVSSYPQLPYESITSQEYEAMRAKVDPQHLMSFKGVEHDQTEKFCDGDACAVK